MNEKTHNDKKIKDEIRNIYGAIAQTGGSCCGPDTSCGCSSAAASDSSKKIGYSDNDISAAPDGANLGLGCGNPVAIASLRSGEIVLDLGSGGGFDSFLAAKKVGLTGKVIGVDMTPGMIERARANAERGGYSNVEFRLGEIEHLPIDDNSVNVIISNCVINLATDKNQVFREAHRVLKAGGRFMVSDTVLNKPLPAPVRESVSAYIGCASGALMKDEYLSMLRAAGFVKVEIVKDAPFDFDCGCANPTALEGLGLTSIKDTNAAVEKTISSITVSAFKKATPDQKKTR
ncbi:MAG: arsenite methyltransferase [Methanoregula sp.]